VIGVGEAGRLGLDARQHAEDGRHRQLEQFVADEQDQAGHGRRDQRPGCDQPQTAGLDRRDQALPGLGADGGQEEHQADLAQGDVGAEGIFQVIGPVRSSFPGRERRRAAAGKAQLEDHAARRGIGPCPAGCEHDADRDRKEVAFAMALTESPKNDRSGSIMSSVDMTRRLSPDSRIVAADGTKSTSPRRRRVMVARIFSANRDRRSVFDDAAFETMIRRRTKSRGRPPRPLRPIGRTEAGALVRFGIPDADHFVVQMEDGFPRHQARVFPVKNAAQDETRRREKGQGFADQLPVEGGIGDLVGPARDLADSRFAQTVGLFLGEIGLKIRVISDIQRIVPKTPKG